MFLQRWNAMIEGAGFAFRFRLPSRRFRRAIGVWAGAAVDLGGALISLDAYRMGLAAWLPTDADRAFVHSLMKPVTEPGKVAGWIAPPDRGINGLPIDYEYVRLA
jgi:benzoyl-CoA 2,3-dioxygenase component B